jgi:hypothetical protein
MSVKVSLQNTDFSLANRGWSQRRISNNLGINRGNGAPVSTPCKPGHFDRQL